MQIYGVSQTEIADLCGIQKQNINLWLTGKQSVSHKHLGKIASYFNQPEDLVSTSVDLIQKLTIIDGYTLYLIMQEPMETWGKYKSVVKKCE